MPNYGDLFDYLELNKDRSNNYYYTEKFCRDNGVDSERLILILYDFGGHNDAEVLYNVVGKIKRSKNLSDEIETPVEFALRNNLYCRWHEGMWVSCKKGSKDARIDLNKANELMFK